MVERRRMTITVAVSVALATTWTAGALAANGDLTQSQGRKGCLADDGGQGCRIAKSPRGDEFAASPDGRHLYVASSANLTTLEIARDGSLRQSPRRGSCFSDSYAPCLPAPRGGGFLSGGLVVAPDGRNVYALSGSAEGVLVFKRNAKSGALRQLKGRAGCFSALGRSDNSDPATAGDCADAPIMGEVASIAISPDGRNIYVGSSFTSKAIWVLNRSRRTGRLGQRPGEAGCISELIIACSDAVATDLIAALDLDSRGRHLYAAVHNSGGIAIFNRARNGTLTQKAGFAGCVTDAGGGGCANGRGLQTTRDVVVSPDDRDVYAVARGSDALTTFSRNRKTGAIEQLSGAAGCLVEVVAPAIAGCGSARLLGVADDIAASRDARSVYALADGFFADNAAHGIGIFRRNPRTGVLTQQAGRAGCFSSDGFSDPDNPSSAGNCRTGRLFGPFGELVLSPGDGSLYSNDSNDGVDILRRKAQRCTGRPVTLMGTPRKDRLRGGPGKDVIQGLGGNDAIRGLGGKDTLCGGKGSDRMIGGRGNDRCAGDAGRDRARSCERSR
jgi:DNA-binding beta-propeller fold protein YncE